MTFVDVRRHGKLLFRYDPERRLVEIKPPHGEVEVVDLEGIDEEMRLKLSNVYSIMVGKSETSKSVIKNAV
jgi:5,10-methylenetetrahydrofolate reductase